MQCPSNYIPGASHLPLSSHHSNTVRSVSHSGGGGVFVL